VKITRRCLINSELERGMDSLPPLILHGGNSSRSRNQALLTPPGKFVDQRFNRECFSTSSGNLENEQLSTDAKHSVHDLDTDVRLLASEGSKPGSGTRNNEGLRSRMVLGMHELVEFSSSGVVGIVNVEKTPPKFGFQFIFVRNIWGDLWGEETRITRGASKLKRVDHGNPGLVIPVLHQSQMLDSHIVHAKQLATDCTQFIS
jgi:hypothetical protein